MGSEKILLIEDDACLGELQQNYLRQQGFDVLWRQHGRDVASDLMGFSPDLIVLDLCLPGIGGLDICRNVRSGYEGAILILTSSDDDFDHVACLELGADDFVSKPVNPRVLLARIRMLLRRGSGAEGVDEREYSTSLRFGDLLLKRVSQEVSFGDESINLSNSEFILLWSLAARADEVVERATLFKILRGIEFDGVDRSVDTKIVSLRKKMRDSSGFSKRIITIRNKGYLFASDAWKLAGNSKELV